MRNFYRTAYILLMFTFSSGGEKAQRGYQDTQV
jgi:hypothetical protein